MALEAAVAAVPKLVEALEPLAALLVAAGEWERAAAVLEALGEALPTRASPRTRAELWRTRARVARERGRSDEAVALLRRAAEADPDDGALLEELEKLHRARAEWGELAEVLGRRVGLEPAGGSRRGALLAELAELCEGPLGRTEEALARWQELAAEAPDDAVAPERVARLALAAGDAARAVDALVRAADALSRAGDGAGAAQRLLEAAGAARRLPPPAGRARAARLYRDALARGAVGETARNALESFSELARESDDPHAELEAIDLRLALLGGHEAVPAVAGGDQAAAPSPERAALLVARARVARDRLGDAAGALASLEPVLASADAAGERSPVRAALRLEALDLAAGLAEQRGRWEDAARWYAELVGAGPAGAAAGGAGVGAGAPSSPVAALKALARIRADRLGDVRGAEWALERLLGVAADGDANADAADAAAAALDLGRLRSERGAVVEAIAAYREALRRSDSAGEEGDALAALVAIAELRGGRAADPAGAAEAWAEVVQRRPASPEFVSRLAAARESAGQWPEAADGYARLAELVEAAPERASMLERAAVLRAARTPDVAGAALAFGAAADAWHDAGQAAGEVRALEKLSELERGRGRLRAAARALSRRVRLDGSGEDGAAGGPAAAPAHGGNGRARGAGARRGAAAPADGVAALGALSELLVELGAWGEATEVLARLRARGQPGARRRLLDVRRAQGAWRAVAELLEEEAAEAAEADPGDNGEGDDDLAAASGDGAGRERALRAEAGEVWAFFCGDLERGLRQLRRAFALDPDDRRTAGALLEALQRAGQDAEVVRLAEQLGDRDALAGALERLHAGAPSAALALRLGEVWSRLPVRPERAERWLTLAARDGPEDLRAAALGALAALARAAARAGDERRWLEERVALRAAAGGADAADLTRLIALAEKSGDHVARERALEGLIRSPRADAAARGAAAAAVAEIYLTTGRVEQATALLVDEAGATSAPEEAAALLARAGRVREEAGDAAAADALYGRAEVRSLEGALRDAGFRRHFARRGEWERLEQSALESEGGDAAHRAAALARLGLLARDEAADPARARAFLARAVEMDPAAPGALVALAGLLGSAGGPDAPVELARLAAAARALPPGAARARAMCDVGDALFRNGADPAAARALLGEASHEATENGDAALAALAQGRAGEAAALAEHDDEAVALLEDACARGETLLPAAERARWLALAADLRRRAGELDAAYATAEAAARAAAESTSPTAQAAATAARVAVARARGDAAGAVALLEERRAALGAGEALRAAGGAPLVEAVALHVSMGDLAMHDLDDAAAAMRQYRDALGLDSGSEWAAVGLADALARGEPRATDREWIAAATALGSAGDAAPPGLRRAVLRRRQAEILMLRLGEEPRGRALLAAAADELGEQGVPSDTSQRRERAELLLSAARVEEALEVLRTITADPGCDVDHRYREGEALLELGRFEEAVSLFRELYAGADRSAAAQLAGALRKAGDARGHADLLAREAERSRGEGGVYRAATLFAYASRAFERLGEEARATDLLEQAAALAARDEVVERLAARYRAAGHREELLALWERTLAALAPDRRARRLSQMAALCATELGDEPRAQRLYEEALAADAACAPALAWRGEREAAAGDWAAARETLRRALKRPDELGGGAAAGRLTALLGRACLETGELDAAKGALDASLLADPRSLAALDARIDLARRQEDRVVLVELLLQRYDARASAASVPPDATAAAPGTAGAPAPSANDELAVAAAAAATLRAADLAAAEELAAAGDLPAICEGHVRFAALRARPTDAEAMAAAFRAADGAAAWDELDDVLRDLLVAFTPPASALDGAPGSGWARALDLAVARFDVLADGLGDAAAARALAEELLAASAPAPGAPQPPLPGRFTLRDRLWGLLSARGDPAAFEAFVHAATADPAYARARGAALFVALGDAHADRGAWGEEADALQRALLASSPGDERAHLRARLARALLRSGGDELAAAGHLVAAYREQPAALPGGLAGAREIYARAGDLPRVADVLQLEVAHVDGVARAILQRERAAVLAQLGDVAGAEAALSAAVAVAADDPEAQRALGLLRFGAGNLAGARGPLLEAARLAPHDVEAWRALARVHAQLDQFAEQVEALRAVVRLDPLDDAAGAELEECLALSDRWDDLAAMLQHRAANATDPTRAARLLWQRALVLRTQLERPGESYVALREAHRLDATSQEILIDYRTLAVAREEWRVAEALLRAEYDLTWEPGGRARIAVARGDVLREHLLDLRGALECYRDAVELDPGRAGAGPRALRAVAEVAEVLGESGEAEAALAELLEREESIDARPGLALRLGHLREKLGHTQAAGEAFRIASASTDAAEAAAAVAALRRAGQAAGVALDPRERVGILQSALELATEPVERADLLAELGRAYAAAEDAESAENVYYELLALRPQDSEAFEFVRRSLEHRGRWDDLARLYESRAEGASELMERATAHYESGRVLIDKLGREEAAANAFRQALDVDVDFLPALDALADIYYLRQDWGHADEMMRRLGDRSARHGTQEMIFRRGEVAEALGREEDAIEHYERVLQTNPGELRAVDALARLYDERGRHAEYEAMLQRLLEYLRPDVDRDRLAEVHYGLAVIRTDRGDHEAARRNLRAVLEFDPERVEALARLAEVNRKLGRWAEAADCYQRLTPRVRDRVRRQEYLMTAAQLYEGPLASPTQALDLLLRAYDEDPTNRQVVERLVRFHALREEWDAVGELGAELLDIAPEETLTGDLALALGKAHRRWPQGDPAVAGRLLRRARQELAGTDAEVEVLRELSSLAEEDAGLDATVLRADVARSGSGPAAPESLTARVDPDRHREAALADPDRARAAAHLAVARYCRPDDVTLEDAADLPRLPTATDLHT
ncbi:MAG TPA: tetratricopeptide repeat protein, partial [Myxococcota bacterium]|nr:tetratricopeptide repeat protein [Myxococcota bacterium]